ncbi:hypothetical protein RDI58_012714 [Solanum bulbocastanum]|uniref:Uncharacterized protein n=1 Tax=Solanum bulbocastanum TaxID=147425 RepID=A0AAN8TJF9_SOLBU
MKISDTSCSSAVKSILCSTCDQFSAELFKVKSGSRPVPVLCNSTDASASSFCSSVWDSCQNIPITNSPFAPSLQTKAGGTKNSNSSLLTDFWQSKAISVKHLVETQKKIQYVSMENKLHSRKTKLYRLRMGCALRRLLMELTSTWSLILMDQTEHSFPIRLEKFG